MKRVKPCKHCGRKRVHKADCPTRNVLDRFRGPGLCELCRKFVRERQPHHIFTRGAHGPDIPENLVSLCAVFAGGRHCHDLLHSNDSRRPSKMDLLDIVARRMGKERHEVLERIWKRRREVTRGRDE